MMLDPRDAQAHLETQVESLEQKIACMRGILRSMEDTLHLLRQTLRSMHVPSLGELLKKDIERSM